MERLPPVDRDRGLARRRGGAAGDRSPGRDDPAAQRRPEREDAASVRALGTLRNQVIPATLGRVPGVRVAVTGLTAGTADFNALMGQRSGLVFGFVLLLAFVLLLVSFRSLVIPATAVVLNLLSVGAAYGVIVALFHWGWGQSIKTTAGVVTAAAIVMVFVFLTFATLSMIQLKEMGVGLAVAVLLDATVVRALLLPAVMKLLGPRNWYLPHWLGWLPQAPPPVPPVPPVPPPATRPPVGAIGS